MPIEACTIFSMRMIFRSIRFMNTHAKITLFAHLSCFTSLANLFSDCSSIIFSTFLKSAGLSPFDARFMPSAFALLGSSVKTTPDRPRRHGDLVCYDAPRAVRRVRAPASVSYFRVIPLTVSPSNSPLRFPRDSEVGERPARR